MQILAPAFQSRRSRRPMRLVVCLAAACAAVVALASSATAAETSFPDDWFFEGAGRPAPLRALEGKTAPELSTQQWIGDSVTLGDLRGKVVVVDFWATWCGPCMASIPHNVALVEKYKDKGLVFVGVHDSTSGWDKAAGVVSDKKINYPVALDDGGKSTKAYNLQFWPTYVVIDHTGTIRGAGLLPDKVEPAVEALLKEAAAAGVGPASAGQRSAQTSAQRAAWYYAPKDRPTSLVEREGKAIAPFLPAISGQASDGTPRWIGAPQPPATWTSRVVVLHYFSPRNSISMRQLGELNALAKDLGPQGVTFVGVCDATIEQATLEAALAERGITLSVLRDWPIAPPSGQAPASAARLGDGTLARSLGVAFTPTTLVVDRGGTLRVAGARVDKVREIANALLAEATPPQPTAPTTSPSSPPKSS